MGMNVGRAALRCARQYRLHKMMLQQCQFRQPKKYWVLKGFHATRLEALFETYPMHGSSDSQDPCNA